MDCLCRSAAPHTTLQSRWCRCRLLKRRLSPSASASPPSASPPSSSVSSSPATTDEQQADVKMELYVRTLTGKTITLHVRP